LVGVGEAYEETADDPDKDEDEGERSGEWRARPTGVYL
jgi:hypothetical protein